MARRRMRLAQYKVGIKHADTNLVNIGNASAPLSTNVLETEGGARTVTGATQVIKDSADTGEVVNVGDIVKYVNLFIQAGPRSDEGANNFERTGWLEWAFVCVKESETAVPATSAGVQTLGAICQHMYRNECIWTGAIPVGNAQPVVAEIKLKIPNFKQRIRLGDEWRFVILFRSVTSTAISTAAVRVLRSWSFKSYS